MPPPLDVLYGRCLMMTDIRVVAIEGQVRCAMQETPETRSSMQDPFLLKIWSTGVWL
jgi:hypothetical protein